MTTLEFDERHYFGDDPNLLDPDTLSWIDSVEDLKASEAAQFDSLDPIILEETRELVRRKVDEINNPTIRSIIKLTHWIPLWWKDYLFSDTQIRIDIDNGDELSCSQIADIIRENAGEKKIHTRKWWTVDKIRTLKERWLQFLGRDTYRMTQGLNREETWRPHAKGEIELWSNWISNEDFEDYLRHQ